LISGEKDLSRMTFEERMDLYKTKYHAERRGGRQDRHRKEQNDIPQKLAEILQEQNVPASQEFQKPKGLFSRLLGIFKK
jgi:hypothetical protein